MHRVLASYYKTLQAIYKKGAGDYVQPPAPEFYYFKVYIKNHPVSLYGILGGYRHNYRYEALKGPEETTLARRSEKRETLQLLV